ncbi:hypothetical protein BGZ49_008198 [Haplosporangium sp. Z 27]|nr:hypothetical protein BGZ49_008198 [Haplosporangium sp. Z 27]
MTPQMHPEVEFTNNSLVENYDESHHDQESLPQGVKRPYMTENNLSQPHPGCPNRLSVENYGESRNDQEPSSSQSVKRPLHFVPTQNTDGYSSEAEDVDREHPKSKRKPIPVPKKLEVIAYRRQNPSISVSKMSEKFDIPRTTLYGVLKFDETTLKNTMLKSDSRTTEVFRTSKKSDWLCGYLLMKWIDYMQSRSTVLSNEKMLTQASVIHRMLNEVLISPLPDIDFNPDWLKRTKGLNKINPTAVTTEDHSSTPKDLRDTIRQFDIQDIRVAGMTSMYLSLSGIQPQGENQCDPSGMVRNTSVSILFCLGASDTHTPPLVHVRHKYLVHDFMCYDGITVHPTESDLTSQGFHDWLLGFDKTLERNTLLLVNEQLWELYNNNNGPSLRYTKVVLSPSKYGLTKRITSTIKLFKYNYHLLLTWFWTLPTESKRRASLLVQLLEVKICFIAMAWRQTRAKINLRELFNELVNGNIETDDLQNYEKLLKQDLMQLLQDIFPNATESALECKWRQYEDTGPSWFLRNEIRQIRQSCSEGWFRSDASPVRLPAFRLMTMAVEWVPTRINEVKWSPKSGAGTYQCLRLVFLIEGWHLKIMQGTSNLEAPKYCDFSQSNGNDNNRVIVYNNDIQQGPSQAYPMGVKTIHLSLDLP